MSALTGRLGEGERDPGGPASGLGRDPVAAGRLAGSVVHLGRAERDAEDVFVVAVFLLKKILIIFQIHKTNAASVRLSQSVKSSLEREKE